MSRSTAKDAPSGPAPPSPGPRGRGISRGLTRGKILAAAKLIVAQRGTANFRVQDLALALEVQSSAIYHHFQNRDDVLAELGSLITGQTLSITEPDAAASPSANMERYVRNLTALMYADPLIARIQLEDIANSGLVDKGEGRRLIQYGRERMGRILADGARTGEFRSVDLNLLRALLLGGISAAICWHDYERTVPAPNLETLQDELVDLLFRYLRP